MCEVCWHTPCLGRCPNAPEPPIVCTCKACGDGIQSGEVVYEFRGDVYHEDCFSEAAVRFLEEHGAVHTSV